MMTTVKRKMIMTTTMIMMDHDGHAHGEFDPHIWLDPINAKAMLNEMAEHLIENDPKNEAKYKSNLAKALTRNR